jgi:hypothetical protein
MRKKFRYAYAIAMIFALAAITSSAWAEECAKLPVEPQMPQGATATEEEMKEGRVTLQAYVKVLEAYEACMDRQIKAAPPDTPPQQLRQWELNAAAVNQAAHSIADVYALQLRVFKGRQ